MIKKYIYWQDGDLWLGYLEEYQDYLTQGETMQELLENLKDIYKEINNNTILYFIYRGRGSNPHEIALTGF